MENHESELSWGSLLVAALMAASILSALFAILDGSSPRADALAISALSTGAANLAEPSTALANPASEPADSIQ